MSTRRLTQRGLALSLLEVGCPAKVWSLVREWYSGDQSCILMDGRKSDWYDMSLGVKQGDIASPILFSTFVNVVVDRFNERPDLGVDLGDGMKRLAIQLFADDMVLMAESAAMLREMLGVLSEFVDENRLKMSTGMKQDKSVAMVYGSSLLGPDPPCAGRMHLCGEPIPWVTSYRYLGVMIDSEGSWEPQLSQLRSSVGKRIADMLGCGMHKDGLRVKRGRDLITLEVNPVLEFGSGVWLMSDAQLRSLEVTWNKAVRAAAGVPTHVSMEALVGDLDLWESLIRPRWMMYRLTMWHRVQRMTPERMVRRCVQLWPAAQRPRATPQQHWTFAVEHDLRILGLTEWFQRDAQGERKAAELDRDEWRDKVKEAVLERSILPTWRRTMSEKPHLAMYARSMKDPHYGWHDIQSEFMELPLPKWRKEPVFQMYLHDKNRRRRQFHTALRAGSLPLQTYAHAYVRCGGSEASALCFMCGQCNESLEHFVNKCPAYTGVKNKYAFSGEFKVQDILDDPVTQEHKNQIHVLFKMWSRRLWVWRKAHPDQKRVQPFL